MLLQLAQEPSRGDRKLAELLTGKWLVVAIAVFSVCLISGCVHQYGPGDCFEMRGTGSIGTVLTNHGNKYIINLQSNRTNARWAVPKNQVQMDTRPHKCPQ